MPSGDEPEVESVDPVDGVELPPESWQRAREFCATHQTRVLTLFFSDLVGSTGQQSALGNLRAAELVRLHQRIYREVLQRFDGREVETAGDSLLAVFAAPSEGVKFALHLQSAMRVARANEVDLPQLRIGLHQGQVVVDEHESGPKAMDIYGLQVSTAARIMSLAEDGQILCSRAVFDDARAIIGAQDLEGLGALVWENHGPYRFKGVADSYEVCEVREERNATSGKPAGTEKARPADEGDMVFGWRPGPDARLPKTNWAMERLLGEGGFGEVWLARDVNMEARKTVFKFCTRKSKVESLQRELNVFNELCKRWQEAHPDLAKNRPAPPGIVEVRNSNPVEPPYFIELEYVAGGDMRQWIDGPGREAPLNMRLQLAQRMIQSVIQVHEAGFVHRDIKPSNFLVTPPDDPRDAPTVKLSDFGIGQEAVRSALESDDSRPESSDSGIQYRVHSASLERAAGTYFFIAPELLRRSHSDKTKLTTQAQTPADVFSLGVTLFQLFTGGTENIPGPGLDEISDAVLREDIDACLDPKPENRPTANELLERLERYEERTRERALAAERDRQRARMRRLAATAASILVVIAIAIAGFVSWRQMTELKRNQIEGKLIEYDQAVRKARDQFLSHGPAEHSLKQALDAAQRVFTLQDEVKALRGTPPDFAEADAAKAYEYSGLIRAQMGDSGGSVRDFAARDALLKKSPEIKEKARSVRVDNPYAMIVFDLQLELFLANEHLKALLLQNDLLKQALKERLEKQGRIEEARAIDVSETSKMDPKERASASLTLFENYVRVIDYMTREWARVQDYEFMSQFQKLQAETHENLEQWDKARPVWEARVESERHRLDRVRNGGDILSADKPRVAYEAALDLVEAQTDLAKFHRRRNDFQAALEAAQEIVRTVDTDPALEAADNSRFAAQQEVAAALVGLGQPDAAKATVDSAAEAIAQSSVARFRSAWWNYAIRYSQIATARSKIGDYPGAVDAAKQFVAIVEARAQSPAGAPDASTLEGAYLTLSWHQLLNRQFDEALATTEKGLVLQLSDVDRAELSTNKAHALLFLERTSEANAVYEEFKYFKLDDEQNEGKLFAQIILADFDAFDEHGLTHPEISAIRSSMRSAVENAPTSTTPTTPAPEPSVAQAS